LKLIITDQVASACIQEVPCSNLGQHSDYLSGVEVKNGWRYTSTPLLY